MLAAGLGVHLQELRRKRAKRRPRSSTASHKFSHAPHDQNNDTDNQYPDGAAPFGVHSVELQPSSHYLSFVIGDKYFSRDLSARCTTDWAVHAWTMAQKQAS